ncbi:MULTISPECIES: DUF1259 domain-containing protein [unclassified Streptomyces]|uniref:DUF1259 domain-containing protein n=1 Tax=unclassified Streptomyces TaxID=2593676 RepID=UPI0038279F1C
MYRRSQKNESGHDRAATPRRRLLAAAAFAPLLAVAGTGPASAGATSAGAGESGIKEAGSGAGANAGRGYGTGATAGAAPEPVRPVATTLADWKGVAKAMGRPGSVLNDVMYRTRFPRHDLNVVSQGVRVSPGLALASHIGFIRYADGSTLAMGDMAVTEDELQRVSDTLIEHGIAQTAIHKHLLAHDPDIWWTHVHVHGRDPMAMARGFRAAFDATATPPARPMKPPPPLDLDVRAMDDVLGTEGLNDGGIYKSVFARRETIIEHGMVLPAGLGSTSAFNFQPLGGGQAAVNGDFVMIASEIQTVHSLLRNGGISLVELHNHGLSEEPRLFFTHFWGVGDGVELAKALRPAVDATQVVPAEN